MRLRRQGSIEPLLTLPIETPRLILRDFVSRDLEAVHAYSSLPDVSRYLVWGPNTLLQSKDMIRGFLLDQKRRPRINFDLQGYAQEAARALMDAGFREIGLQRIFATCDQRNKASARVMERLGLRREGAFRLSKYIQGEWCDEFLYAILAEEFMG